MAQRKGEDYVATRLRAPKKPLILLRTLSDTTAPAYGRGAVGEFVDRALKLYCEGEIK